MTDRSNLQVCPVDETGFCYKCQSFPLLDSDARLICIELQDDTALVNADSGEFDWERGEEVDVEAFIDSLGE